MTVQILTGDCREVLRTLPDESVHCVVTSPPYWGLRDYGTPGIGLEPTLAEHMAELVGVFCEIRRVLRKDGTLWLNYGDAYAGAATAAAWRPGGHAGDGGVPGGRNRNGAAPGHGLKPKDLMGMPWRLAFALQADGWWLRQDIIWAKPNPMPESVTDRCTKAHEYLFMLTKSARYFYDAAAISEPVLAPGLSWAERKALGEGARRGFAQNGPSNIGCDKDTRNKRSVWEVATAPFSEAHFATFPPALIEPCIKAGCPAGGTVLDPFGGAGTTGLVADRLQRNAILIELNPEYAAMAQARIKGDAPLFTQVAAE